VEKQWERGAEWECDRIIATARTDHGRGTAEESGPRRADQNKSGVSHESRTLIFKVAYTHSTTGDKSSIMTAIKKLINNSRGKYKRNECLINVCKSDTDLS
jgi:hypothetical protein